MTRYYVYLVIVATTLHLCYSKVPVIDKNVFKNCSRIAFCSNFRHHILDEAERYRADVKSFKITNNVVTVPIKNDNKSGLNLRLSILDGDKARIEIEESRSTRYHLNQLVVTETLKQLPITSEITNERTLSIVSQNADQPHRIVVTPGPPFTVEFYHQQNLQVVFNADKLLVQNLADSQAFAFNVEFDGASRLYGLFNHAYKLALGETMDGSSDPFRLKNSDSYGYEADSTMALYGAVPVIYGHSRGRSSGIFLHNAAEQWIDITYQTSRPSAYFMVGGAAFDIFILLGPTPTNLTRQLTTMTGKAELPQIWTLGYHQSRFSYKSQEDVKNVVALMDKHEFPLDSIWLDADHSDDNKWFTWNHTTFSNPIEMQKNISATGRKCVTISNPNIKVDEKYSVYTALQKLYLLKWANESNYEANSSPGKSSWIDFLRPRASDYYTSLYSYERFNGSTETLAGIWNSMNEPAVFDDTTEKTLPSEVLHNGTIKNCDAHNIYGLLQAKATHKGLVNRDKKLKRPFVLSRSVFAGSQRYAAVWTGDNSATWAHFANSYPQCMTANILGMIFCGADIGGFLGDPDDQLLQRWYQGAVWTPFFRGHSSRESKRREPYLFSPEVQEVIRNALRLRYKHIPVFYTLFFEHYKTGDPIIRPLFYQYPGINDRDTQMLIGTDIMSVAVTQENVNSVEVYIPGTPGIDYWYRVDRNETWTVSEAGEVENAEVDINSSPVYYRAGSIVVRYDDKVQSTAQAVKTSYAVYVNLDEDGKAVGRIYKDDFVSYNYTDHKYLYWQLIYDNKFKGLEFKTIGGTSTGFEFCMDLLVIHRKTLNEINGESEVEEKRYTTDADGTPLNQMVICRELTEEPHIKIFL